MEKQIDDVVCHLFTLLVAYGRDVFPKWAVENLEAVRSGKVAKKLEELNETLAIRNSNN